jgi:hypothetical protein
LLDKGPQLVSVHVLKLRKLARKATFRPFDALARQTPFSLIAATAAEGFFVAIASLRASSASAISDTTVI